MVCTEYIALICRPEENLSGVMVEGASLEHNHKSDCPKDEAHQALHTSSSGHLS